MGAGSGGLARVLDSAAGHRACVRIHRRRDRVRARLAQGILTPFIFNLARRYASAILGGIGLISTFLALWIATLFPGGLTIRGIGWVLAPLLVWTVTALGGWILMGVVFKRYLNTGNGRKRS
jgi:hypothetical protein